LLHSQQAPPLSSILTSLLNEILSIDKEFILILDDYHVISDQAIRESMLFLIDHLPSNLHLVLATRTDPDLPLARLRGRGHLLEICDQELLFDQQETNNFLVEAMGLPLSQEEVSTLQQRTEGWITGLQLAALSLHKQKNHSTWISGFVGSHRYILDYIQQDILAQLPASLEHFLLQTSILTRMNAALCQAVGAGTTVEACQHLLEEVEKANLFVVPLDEQRNWYRYHDLFREALLARLMASQPELVPPLHQRAARYYETMGQWHEAIAHALASPDYPLAASLMEKAAPVLWLSGQARTMQNWMLMLPDAILYDYSRLALDAMLYSLNSVQMSTEEVYASMVALVERNILRFETLLHRKPVPRLSHAQGEFIGRRLYLLHAFIESRAIHMHGDIERLDRLSRELEMLPPDEETGWKLIPLSLTFLQISTIRGDGALLIEKLQAAKQQILETGDYLGTFRVMNMLALAHLKAEQLHQAYRQAQEGLALIEQIGGQTWHTGYLQYILVRVYYAWNQLQEASDVLHQMLRLAQAWHQVDLLSLGEHALVQISLARGALSTAQQALHRLETLVRQERFATHNRWLESARVHYWLAQGNLAEASAWAVQTASSPQTRITALHKQRVLMLVQVLLAQKQFNRATETLDRFSQQLDRKGDIETTIHFLALSVVVLHLAGRSAQAASVAARLFTLTEPQGHLRLYLDAGPLMREALKALLAITFQADQGRQQDDESQIVLSKTYLLHLLTAFDQEKGRLTAAESTTLTDGLVSHGPSPWFTSELLSPQERRVLRLLASGLSREEIAQMLVISLNTVKTHLQRIYQKLQVRNRFQACEIAHRFDSESHSFEF
jgi:LuxR family maltose regulon positive regulatory protein